MSVNEATLTELINLARQRGSISMEDLRKALPIDSMTFEDISDVLVRLDEAGFDLEGDPVLLLPEGKTVPKNAVPVAKREQTVLPEIVLERKKHLASLPTSVDDPILKNREVWRSDSTDSAPMLPWILAFAIVVLAVFAAFAF